MKQYLKTLMFLLVMTSQCALFSLDTELSKQAQWNSVQEQVDLWCDGLGLPIDEEIKDVVIALNLLGYETRQSCGGHENGTWERDWTLFPWIDFAVPADLDLLTKQGNFINYLISGEPRHPYDAYVLKDLKFDQTNLEGLKSLSAKIYAQSEKAYAKYTEKFRKLISSFYQDRIIENYETILVLLPYQSPRIQSLGVNDMEFKSEEEKEIFLIACRKEMKAFAVYLKNSFFHEAISL